MIIVSVGAGLGNQMYEYSFYKYLTKLFPDKEIKVDIKYAFPKAHNGIEVFDIFGLSAPIASFDEVKKLVGFYPLNGEGYKKNNIVLKIIKKLNLHPKTLLIQDDFTEYYESFFNLNADKSYYLLGPFANHKYFIEIEEGCVEDNSNAALIPNSEGEIRAGIPGSIFKVLVNVGDKVAKGQAVIVIEAMKMEIEVAAPVDGVVSSVRVNVGDTIVNNQLLVTL